MLGPLVANFPIRGWTKINIVTFHLKGSDLCSRVVGGQILVSHGDIIELVGLDVGAKLHREPMVLI